MTSKLLLPTYVPFYSRCTIFQNFHFRKTDFIPILKIFNASSYFLDILLIVVVGVVVFGRSMIAGRKMKIPGD